MHICHISGRNAARHWPPSVSGQKRRIVYMDDPTWEALRSLAAERGTTISEVVRRAVLAWAMYETTLPPHMEVAGVCQRDGQAWPCAASLA